MALFGGGTTGPTKINRVQINQSVQGFALGVVMGRGRIQQTIIWADGLKSKKIAANGGKGIGGGKGGTQYLYSADVIAAICNGGGYVIGVGDVWSGQSWLSTAPAEESYTITGGTPIYTPINSATLAADGGVRQSIGYSGSFNDVGSSAPLNLSGAQSVPFRRVPWGTPLTTGTYSVNPTTNQYNFSPADVGRTVTLSYSYSLTRVKQQSIAIVPSGRTVQVGDSQAFLSDGGVVYAAGANEGKALQRVGGSPTTGQYSVSGSQPATYTFASGDINQEVRLTYFLDNTASLPEGTATILNFTLFEGEKGQAPWALLQSSFPDAALGYSGITLAAYGPMDLGYSGQIQQNTFEIQTADAWGGGIADCSPVQCILRVLSDTVWGLGKAPNPFPASAIDTGDGGTWGFPLATGGIRQESTATAWFASNGFFISPVIDQQDTAASLISRWLEAGQCAAFMSEGLLKLVPFGDTSTAGNGMVWVAPQVFAAELDDTDFLIENEGDDPVQISEPEAYTDSWNKVQINWSNRAQQYAPELTPESDQAAINRYGERIEDPQAWDFITTLPSAQFAASVRVKRKVYIRNTYSFRLSHRYNYLEPMDPVAITTSSSWSLSNPLGIVRMPVRITKTTDNPDGTTDYEAEEYAYGTSAASFFTKGTATGSLVTNGFAAPGNAEAVVFEPTKDLVGFNGNQIWIGACGLTPDWGSCNVYASTDGSTYKYIDKIESPTPIGTLVSAFGTGSDPDTSNSLVVAMATGSQGLDGGTTTDADNDSTLTLVGNEFISYSSAAVTGPNQYTLSGYIRRGRKGTTIASHAIGTMFMRLDASILKYQYDPALIGKTIYFKFQSINAFGNSPQDLSTLSPLAYTIAGNNGVGNLGSGDLPPNVPRNSTNDAQLTSEWIGSAASVSVFGPGGPGTSWTSYIGTKTTVYPAGTLVSLLGGTTYRICFDTRNSTFLAVFFNELETALNDYYIIVGEIVTATSTSGGTSGGADPSCTVEGTALDTPDGPVDNREIFRQFSKGERVSLSGRYGPERVIGAEWVPVDEVYLVSSSDYADKLFSFECSGTHMLRVGGHYSHTYRLSDTWVHVETRHGYQMAQIRRTQKHARVLRLHLSGPSHEYSVGGVWSHNLK